jgi:rSAM/selenodomain-associated transferase 2
MKLSVVIPTYNEAAHISETIKLLESRSGEGVREIIVVDGQSSDETRSKACAAGAKVFVSPKKGRASQMNYGAEQAKAELLYFLHADSIPPPHFETQVIQAVKKEYPAGCFRLTFDQSHPLLDAYAWFTRFNIDAFRFGDQSLFITSEAFEDIGGFREDHIVMEDNEIVRRIKQRYPFTILDDAVETSARSYRKVGVVKLQLIFILIYSLYFVGVEQEVLADIKSNILS